MVSIITPTYNHELFIADCIESVLAQDFDDWEQIVVDDGSNDGAVDVIKAYVARDSRIRLIESRHRGIDRLAESYNLALSQARGDLVAILEGDDLWPKDKLTRQVPVHTDENVVFSYGVVQAIRDGVSFQEFPRPSVTEGGTEQYLKLLFTRGSHVVPASVMVRKKSLDLIGGFWQDKGFPAVDYSTWLRLFQLPGKIIYVSECLGYWRQSANQVTNVHGIRYSEQSLRIAIEQLDHLSSDVVQRMNIDSNDVWRCHFPLVVDAHLTELRRALKKRNRRLAREESLWLFKHGRSLRRRAQAVVGAAHGVFRTDMEWIFRVADGFHDAPLRRKDQHDNI